MAQDLINTRPNQWIWSAPHNDHYYVGYSSDGVQSYFFSKGSIVPVAPYPAQQLVQNAQQSSLDRPLVSDLALVVASQGMRVREPRLSSVKAERNATMPGAWRGRPSEDEWEGNQTEIENGYQYVDEDNEQGHQKQVSSNEGDIIFTHTEAPHSGYPSSTVGYNDFTAEDETTNYSGNNGEYGYLVPGGGNWDHHRKYTPPFSYTTSSATNIGNHGDHVPNIQKTHNSRSGLAYDSLAQSMSGKTIYSNYAQFPAHTSVAVFPSFQQQTTPITVPQLQTQLSNQDSAALIPTYGNQHTSVVPVQERPRRLIVCCDGTWNALEHRTNVRRIYEATYRGVHFSEYEQLKYYVEGVGTKGGWMSKLRGGAFGEGLEHNILDAYEWLCKHYVSEKDEVIIVGFSRGAFTAQCLAHLLNDIGVLNLPQTHDATKKGWNKLIETWRQLQEKSDQIFTRTPCLLKAGIPHQEYKRCRIRALALFDTVAAVGREGIWHSTPERLSFASNSVPGNVRCAFHALALHEQRSSFLPSIWKCTEPDSNSEMITVLVKQCWFAGFHTFVGGHDKNTGVSHIHHFSLLWMMGQLERWVSFDSNAMVRQILDDMQFPLVFRPIDSYDEDMGLWHVLGKGKREVGYSEDKVPQALSQQQAELFKFSPGVRVHWTTAMHLSWLRLFGMTCYPLSEASRPLAGLWDTQRYWTIAGAEGIPEEPASRLERQFLEDYALRFGMEKAIELVIKAKLGYELDKGLELT